MMQVSNARIMVFGPSFSAVVLLLRVPVSFPPPEQLVVVFPTDWILDPQSLAFANDY